MVTRRDISISSLGYVTLRRINELAEYEGEPGTYPLTVTHRSTPVAVVLPWAEFEQMMARLDERAALRTVIASLTDQAQALLEKIPRKPYPKVLYSADGGQRVVATCQEERTIRHNQPRVWSTDARVGQVERLAAEALEQARRRAGAVLAMLAKGVR